MLMFEFQHVHYIFQHNLAKLHQNDDDEFHDEDDDFYEDNKVLQSLLVPTILNLLDYILNDHTYNYHHGRCPIDYIHKMTQDNLNDVHYDDHEGDHGDDHGDHGDHDDLLLHFLLKHVLSFPS
jgi:hypothetical protein